ncbi:protein spaetzle isoform X3 [Drosophila biarmipes]|uniref:protein spaetzle isoform X3 n=1 Tax=Drosophila biarmipes TaxID=125945 RepID=UPI0007E82AB8|nr:protein spaetzle isoform X3 [Drosophila biarmipes]
MMMMTPMWITMLKVLVLLTALFTSFEAKEYDGIIQQIFKLNNEKGVVLFNTTTADSASLMPIPTQRGGTSQNQSPIPEPNRHYHQYHSLSQSDQDQFFKVQRSPDGKLNLVFNDTFVSLQKSAEVQSDQPHLQRHPSDTFVFPDSPLATYRPPLTPPLTPPQALANATDKLKPCRKNSSDQLKTFCTEVDDYPDLSKFKAKLEQTYAKFFMNEPQPTDVSSRVGGDSDELYLCKSTRRIIYPKKGQKSDNTWQLIVNDDEYKQGIQIEECEQEGSTCDYASNFPQHYRPICKQHYIQQTLVSIQGDDVSQGSFRIPSCCKCALKVL